MTVLDNTIKKSCAKFQHDRTIGSWSKIEKKPPLQQAGVNFSKSKTLFKIEVSRKIIRISKKGNECMLDNTIKKSCAKFQHARTSLKHLDGRRETGDTIP